MTPKEALAFFDIKKAAYLAIFNTPHGKIVLDDLMPFCRARETCVIPGNRDKTFVLEGRREVYLRIQDFRERTPEELVALYTQPQGERHDGRIEVPDDE